MYSGQCLSDDFAVQMTHLMLKEALINLMPVMCMCTHFVRMREKERQHACLYVCLACVCVHLHKDYSNRFKRCEWWLWLFYQRMFTPVFFFFFSGVPFFRYIL